MARGYIYEINKDNEPGYMGESDFYEKAGTIAEYFSDVSAQDGQADEFLEELGQYGFIIDKTEKSFMLPDNKESTWFRSRYEQFMKLTKNLTFEQFTNPVTAYNLTSLVHDGYSDAVYINDCFYEMDTFMRELIQTDVKYYVKNIVLMH